MELAQVNKWTCGWVEGWMDILDGWMDCIVCMYVHVCMNFAKHIRLLGTRRNTSIIGTCVVGPR